MKTNAGAAAAVQTKKSNASPKTVPHVVRVTFLGVAGISANNEGQAGSTNLTFPPASKLRAVASISRTYKSGGKPSGVSNCLSKSIATGGSVNSATSAERRASERYVAVFNDDCKEVNENLLNTTNNVAFEAELVRSEGRTKNDPSSKFAPKTFCVTLGLVADEEDHDETSNDVGASPMVAIPIGFTNLTINGEETLNGRRKQLDLPLSTVDNFIGPFGVESPLIQLTKSTHEDVVTSASEIKTKKAKGMTPRMFKKGAKSEKEIEARSIFQLGRMPNDEERNLFLERFGVDQSGDAIIRVGLEVFQRGSELEKTFRQKYKMRKRNKQKQTGVKDAVAKHSTGKSSVGKRSREKIAASSSSLLDDDDSSESDYSQSCTHISSVEGSWEDDNERSWEDDEESHVSFDDTVLTMDTMDTRDTTETRDPIASRPIAKGVFGRMLDCAMPSCAKDEDIFMMQDGFNGEVMSEYNIDAVASAMASMSVSVDGQESECNSIPAGSPAKSARTPVKTTKRRDPAKEEVARISPVAPPKMQEPKDAEQANVSNDDDVPSLSRDTKENSVAATNIIHSQNQPKNEPIKVAPKKKDKSRGGFSLFRRNNTKKDKSTAAAAVVEEPPPSNDIINVDDIITDEIRNLIEEEIEGHEFTLGQHSLRSM